MTEILPILLFFQAVSDRLELEQSVKEQEENFILEVGIQLKAMERSQAICREVKNAYQKKGNYRIQAKAKGNPRRLDRPKRRDAE